MKQPVDIFSSLVIDVFNNKGVYALLLGSGISLPAKIMSGWKVTEDIIKKLAVVQGEDIPIDPFVWFKEKYGCEAEYSKLLEQLGKKPSEMESLLRPYFEPSEEDVEMGYKNPTVAHKAIAEMAKRGYFKVIITTNFDRLLESAFNEIGVRYQVICHDSEIESRVPLYHHPLTLLKINGDYKDCRFKNTEAELSCYPDNLLTYLDSILKNFGLISCGWSATWDKALVKQILDNKCHRYSYFYTYVGERSKEIETIMNGSNGESLQIENADTFFTEMNERLKALEIINSKNMEADKEVAVARLKMYISDLKNLIKYTDLYENVTEQLLNETKELVYGPEFPSASLFEKVLAENSNALDVIMTMSVVAIRWADVAHYDAIVDSLTAVANRKIVTPTQGYENTVKLNHVLDTAYLYGLGTACVFYEKFSLLDQLLKVKFYEQGGRFSPYIIDEDNCWLVDSNTWNSSAGYTRLKTPFSTNLFNRLRHFFYVIKDDKEYFSTICIFEKLLSMYYYIFICKERTFDMWPPMGAFCWQPFYLERNKNSTYKKFFETIEREKENSQFLKSGMFEGKYVFYKEAFDAVTNIEKEARRSLY